MVSSFSDPDSESQAASSAKEHQRPLPCPPSQQPPRQWLHPTAVAADSRGGIGGAFLRSSSPQQSILPPPPPPLNNNHFQPPGNKGAHNGGINVDNIFASMGAGDDYNDNPNSNNMFQNFATNNAGITAAAVGGGGSILPYRKYSDCTNQRSRTIPANDISAAVEASSPRANAANQMIRSESGTFSKSVGTSAAFLMRGNRNMSECESDTPRTIRYAGYLLKRSNLPYETSPAAATNVLDNIITGIDPLPDLSQVKADANVFNLTFGRLDDAAVGPSIVRDAGINVGLSSANKLTQKGTLDTASSPAKIRDNNHAFQPILDPAPTTVLASPETEDTVEGDVYSEKNEPCFCYPVVQYFKMLFRAQGKNGVPVTDAKGHGKEIHSKAICSPVLQKKTRRSPRSRTSPRPITRPLPITPTQLSPNVNRTNRYNLPLKSPAKSDPVPISPPPRRRDASIDNMASIFRDGDDGDGRLSKSFSNNCAIATVNTSTTTATFNIATPKKECYLPPPPNVIDPRDGHIWRAKYCILEEGILYFYRTAAEGESAAAQKERSESRAYASFEEGDEISLGEVCVTGTSPDRAVPARRGLTGQGAGTEKQSSRRDLYNLSKSPMPMKQSDFLNFTRSPFHRTGSSILTSEGSRRGSSETISEDNERSTLTRSMRHSGSTATFQPDAEVLWEKRVALDCVGAVRSSTQEHGLNSFELLAYGSTETTRKGDCYEQSDASTRASREDSSVGEPPPLRQQEIIDRLVLRAGTSDDMNAWMFEFHRSLTSFMRQIVRSADIARRNANRRGLIHPGSPGTIHNRLLMRANVAKGGDQSPFVNTQQSFATSPSMSNNSHGEGIVGSLSHGHGRNALYRRKIRDNNSSNKEAVISPLPTPIGTPVGGSSPQENVVISRAPDSGSLVKKQQSSLMPTAIIQSCPSNSTKVDLPSLRDLKGEASVGVPSAAAAPKKYIPPHLRNSTPKKWIPPHIRRKKMSEAAASKNNVANTDAEHDAQKSVLLNVKPNETKNNGASHAACSASEALDEPLVDIGLLPIPATITATTSGMLSRQLKDTSNDSLIPSFANVRLGGCADHAVVAGSILDPQFVPRKASVVGNVRLEAFGGTGGGNFASPSNRQSSLREEKSVPPSNNSPNHRSVLRWEAGASSECGIRNSNEDSYVAIGDLDGLIRSQGLVSFSDQDLEQTMQQGLYAIFDGHVGNQAARFSAERFHEILIEEQSALASRDSAGVSSIEKRADFILHRAFDRLDKDFCSLCTADGRDWDCGSTALVALITDDVVSLANLGDCQGVVCRSVLNGFETDDGWALLEPPDSQDEDLLCDSTNGGGSISNTHTSSRRTLFWKEVTKTHSPLHDEERDRIEKANGWILKETEIPIGQLHRMDIFDEDVVEIVKRCFSDRMKHHRCDPVRLLQIARTCGDLAVSRAIGDRDFKAAYNAPSSPDTVAASDSRIAADSNTPAEERKKDLVRSWKGPPVFIYPEDHSGQFRGDLVSSVPDVRSFRVGQKGVVDNEFLLMACDGLWDVMDGDDAVRIAKHLLFDRKLSAKDGAARLAELAQHLGSSDNITVILIRFYWAEEKCDE